MVEVKKIDFEPGANPALGFKTLWIRFILNGANHDPAAYKLLPAPFFSDERA